MSLGVAAIGTRPRPQRRLSTNPCLRSATLTPVRTPTPGESSHDRRRRDGVVCIIVFFVGGPACFPLVTIVLLDFATSLMSIIARRSIPRVGSHWARIHGFVICSA